MAAVETHGQDGKPLEYIRMHQIMERIENGETLSITELAREWDVTTKMLQRDFRRLQEINAPIERAEDGKRFRKKQVQNTSNDAQLILEMIDSLARDVGGAFYTKTHPLLTRLQQYISTPIYSRVDIEDIGDKFEMMRQLETAIHARKVVSFDYKRWYAEEIKHYEKVAPLKILLFDGFWYLLTLHEGHYKKFYFKAISNFEKTDTGFTVSKAIDERIVNALNVWFDPSKEPFEVTLWLDTDAVVYFERKPIGKNQKLYRKPDGTAELVIKITDKDEIFPVLRYWLPNIRILEPEGLQKEFEASLLDYLNNSR